MDPDNPWYDVRAKFSAHWHKEYDRHQLWVQARHKFCYPQALTYPTVKYGHWTYLEHDPFTLSFGEAMGILNDRGFWRGGRTPSHIQEYYKGGPRDRAGRPLAKKKKKKNHERADDLVPETNLVEHLRRLNRGIDKRMKNSDVVDLAEGESK